MGLREFIRAKKPGSCHEAAAVLFYYSREFEGVEEGDADFMAGMFRRAGKLLSGPQHMDQLLRDAYNQYGYLERVRRAVYRLSPDGEELVLAELPRSGTSQGDDCEWIGTLHPRVIDASGSLCQSRHFGNAVADAVKGLNNRIKDLAGQPTNAKGRQQDGKDLLMSALDQDNGAVKINACATESERNEQEGFKFLCAGAWLAWRNPMSHDNTPHLPEIEAREMLGLVSRLHRYLDLMQREET